MKFRTSGWAERGSCSIRRRRKHTKECHSERKRRICIVPFSLSAAKTGRGDNTELLEDRLCFQKRSAVLFPVAKQLYGLPVSNVVGRIHDAIVALHTEKRMNKLTKCVLNIDCI